MSNYRCPKCGTPIKRTTTRDNRGQRKPVWSFCTKVGRRVRLVLAREKD